MQRILVTNDDGIDAQGIHRLVKALLSLSDVEIYVVAPTDERSGVGHGVTYRFALAPVERDFHGLPVKAWAVNGNPADCVKASYYLLFADDVKPDIIFSGINVGTNLGRDIYYSGTCSAAREAVILGMPAIALSYGNWDDQDDFGQVTEIVTPILREFLDKAEHKRLAEQVFWNVNIPHLPADQIKGIVPAALSLHHYQDKYHFEAEGYWLQREYPELAELREEDYDLHKLGYITVTPIHIDSTDRALLRELHEWPMVKSRGKSEV